MYETLYVVAYDKKQMMLDRLDYYLLSPDLNNKIIEHRSQLSVQSLMRRTGLIVIQYPLITFQRRETRLLRPPHDTRCMDYHNMGLESQLHILHDCVKHESTKTLRLVPPDVSVFHLNETTVPLISLDQMQNVTIKKSLFLIRDSCREKCRNLNCKDEHFKPFDSLFAFNTNYMNTSVATYTLSKSKWPDILIEARTAFSFVNFMMTMLNAFSLWTAFCPMNLKELRVNEIMRGTSACMRKMLSLSAKSWKLLVTVLCLTACLFQLQESAVQYFEYKTVSKVSIQMMTEREPPAITLCVQPEGFNVSSYTWYERW